jgi:hypothetical protein
VFGRAFGVRCVVVPVPVPAGTHGIVVGDVVEPGVVGVVGLGGVGAIVPRGVGAVVPCGVGAVVPCGVGAVVPCGVGATVPGAVVDWPAAGVGAGFGLWAMPIIDMPSATANAADMVAICRFIPLLLVPSPYSTDRLECTAGAVINS